MQCVSEQCPSRAGHLPWAHYRSAIRRSKSRLISFLEKEKSGLHQVSVLTCCSRPAGLLGADLPFLRLLQGGQNPLSKHHLQFAAGVPAGHHRLPVPQPHLDCEAVPQRTKSPKVLNVNIWTYQFLIWLFNSRSATGFKRNLVQDEDRFQSFCNKIFAGWDFCITNENAAKLKRSSLLYELRVSRSLPSSEMTFCYSFGRPGRISAYFKCLIDRF